MKNKRHLKNKEIIHLQKPINVKMTRNKIICYRKKKYKEKNLLIV